MYTTDCFGLLGKLQAVRSAGDFQPELLENLFNVGLAVATITSVSLRGGIVTTIMVTGVVSMVLQRSANALLGYFPLDNQYWAGVRASATSGAISGAVTTLARGPFPHGLFCHCLLDDDYCLWYGAGVAAGAAVGVYNGIIGGMHRSITLTMEAEPERYICSTFTTAVVEGPNGDLTVQVPNDPPSECYAVQWMARACSAI